MAYGYSAVLPLQRDNRDGFYVLTKTIAQNIRQNFKNLLLTVPGERVMLPNFGIGLRRYLFENNSFDLQGKISDRIDTQINLYMPFVSVNKVEYFEETSPTQEHYGSILYLNISYSVPSHNIYDMIAIT
jgi:phage baseplate assembly protein W